MKTLIDRYPLATVGQVELIAIMAIWDKNYYVLPSSQCASIAATDRKWIVQQANEGKLIATKYGGVWWIAVSPVPDTRNKTVTGVCDCAINR